MNTHRQFIVHIVFGFLPSTRCFALKRTLLRWSGAKVGRNVRVASSAKFYLTGELVIGDDTWIGHQVLVAGGDAAVIIGARADIGPRVLICTGSHELVTTSNRAAGRGYSSQVVVGDGVWLGAAAVVLGGVTVGECSMVAAGGLVHRSVAPRTVVGGVPARVISQQDEGGGNEVRTLASPSRT